VIADYKGQPSFSLAGIPETRPEAYLANRKAWKLSILKYLF
jgi:hypothetical protein